MASNETKLQRQTAFEVLTLNAQMLRHHAEQLVGRAERIELLLAHLQTEAILACGSDAEHALWELACNVNLRQE